MTQRARSRYTGFRFPPEVISHAVWLYFRFPLSLRMIEEMLAARGIVVSHETVRQWARKFRQAAAAQAAEAAGASAAGDDHGQARQLCRGDEGPPARCRASPAQGAQ